MLQCDGCDGWFHLQCINQSKSAGRSVAAKKQFYCPACVMALGQPGAFAFPVCVPWPSHYHNPPKKREHVTSKPELTNHSQVSNVPLDQPDDGHEDAMLTNDCVEIASMQRRNVHAYWSFAAMSERKHVACGNKHARQLFFSYAQLEHLIAESDQLPILQVC